MEFLLLAVIFLTSSGFLVGAAVAPTPAAAMAMAHNDPTWGKDKTASLEALVR